MLIPKKVDARQYANASILQFLLTWPITIYGIPNLACCDCSCQALPIEILVMTSLQSPVHTGSLPGCGKRDVLIPHQFQVLARGCDRDPVAYLRTAGVVSGLEGKAWFCRETSLQVVMVI
jgi:hypothetical protein